MGVSEVCLLGHVVQFRLFNSVTVMIHLGGTVCELQPFLLHDCCVRCHLNFSPMDIFEARVYNLMED